MGAVVTSIIELGMLAAQVDIECHTSNGLPGIVVVGFGNKAVDEARERLRSAFAEAGLEMPRKRITLNLAPADLPKDGTTFDLAMAAAILQAAGQIDAAGLAGSIVIGELGLDGSVRAVRGIIGKLLASRSLGIRRFYIPYGNLAQAQLVPGVELIPVPSLKDFYLDQTGQLPLPRHRSGKHVKTQATTTAVDFSDVIGQARAKRALEIAAAGGHNILLNGAPGAGKSMLAKAFCGILPALSQEELLEVNHIHSLASRRYDALITQRPLRSPHHSASSTSVLGGGSNPRPGEISLAHRGVLFMDELPEYGRSVIEALRQPLEDHTITIARARDTITYPADFIFIATSNPCPCGFYGTSKPCSCTPLEMVRYQRKLSGPILDRIDLYIDVEEVDHARLLGQHAAETSTTIRQRVEAARRVQLQRGSALNAQLDNRQLKQHANLTAEAKTLLDQASHKLHISARAYMKIVKVARTIADLGGTATIGLPEITEALQYRRQTLG